jgi:hypothetical protein
MLLGEGDAAAIARRSVRHVVLEIDLAGRADEIAAAWQDLVLAAPPDLLVVDDLELEPCSARVFRPDRPRRSVLPV